MLSEWIWEFWWDYNVIIFLKICFCDTFYSVCVQLKVSSYTKSWPHHVLQTTASRSRLPTTGGMAVWPPWPTDLLGSASSTCWHWRPTESPSCFCGWNEREPVRGTRASSVASWRRYHQRSQQSANESAGICLTLQVHPVTRTFLTLDTAVTTPWSRCTCLFLTVTFMNSLYTAFFLILCSISWSQPKKTIAFLCAHVRTKLPWPPPPYCLLQCQYAQTNSRTSFVAFSIQHSKSG